MENVRNKQYPILLTGLMWALVGLCLMALSLGRYSMNPADVMRVVIEKATNSSPADAAMHDVLFVIRIPRVIAAILVGGSLSLSGAVYQGVFKNPLVSPDLLGVSSGACVGAAMAILLLDGGMVMIQFSAFAVGMLAVGMSIGITRLLRNDSNMALVLAGIITGGFMSSLLGILKYIADPQTQLAEIVFWQMGSVASVNQGQIVAVSPLFFICGGLLLALSWRINILSFGEEEAKTLGMNVGLYRGLTIVCASLLTANAVSISGTIGWIGLVIPHLGRLLAGADNTKLLPITILLGGLFMLFIDTLSRAATSVEIPLSILTGLIGAPFYAWLLWKQRTGAG
ncbi:ABC-type Fe3+-hydroxamate transport system, periplasmic component [Clostridium aceticum]|uniref:ABC-type Fe3+-hydroxamate transport system, periplasmic component n=1 Tax=Clostridium aceticum TaxID=84022 RepID=A0A0D8IDL5_9CLOT|nr:iron ABC transporter permease [Clostridium aceticum]AKL94380.1 ABC-type Fe3+-hydroxamate transport system, periplasmic component [Clostridium aceticum]KJF28390.1 iron ABC transporter permease [Clostridium aceticum]